MAAKAEREGQGEDGPRSVRRSAAALRGAAAARASGVGAGGATAHLPRGPRPRARGASVPHVAIGIRGLAAVAAAPLPGLCGPARQAADLRRRRARERACAAALSRAAASGPPAWLRDWLPLVVLAVVARVARSGPFGLRGRGRGRSRSRGRGRGQGRSRQIRSRSWAKARLRRAAVAAGPARWRRFRPGSHGEGRRSRGRSWCCRRRRGCRGREC